jgi:acetyl-CoA C-acetyltransferase
MCVIASEDVARNLCDSPIWIKGFAWFSAESYVWSRDLSEAKYARLAAGKAYRMAGIEQPTRELDFVELCDEYSYKELQHLEAMGLARKGEAGHLTMTGVTSPGGDLPVNVSGGSLGVGHTFECSGGMKVSEAVDQLRHTAGKRQVKNARTGMVQSWRGVPTATGSVAILSNEV